MPAILASHFPALKAYCPIVGTVSPQQALFLLCAQREVFYGGAAGGGKSAALLMAALQYVDVPGYRALILRRTFAQLSKGDALIPLSHEWLARTDATWNEQRKTWTFPSGATLEFGHVENDNDRFDYQGAAFHFVGFDELTQFTELVYEYIAFSRQRRRTDMAQLGIPVRVRSTANPGGSGHGWVKKRFIDERDSGVVFIPAKVADNPGLDVADYAESLMHLDEVTRRQLLDGDWGVAEGLAFKYSDALHSVAPFEIPKDWQRLESLDHGLANPTVVLAWAADYDGNLIVFDSYYSERNQLISDHARALLAKRPDWWPKDEHGYPVHMTVCHADHDLWGKTGGETDYGAPATLLTEYAAHGIDGGFVQANKDPKAGRARLLELMRPDPERPFPAWHRRYGEKGAPSFYVVKQRCPELVEQLKIAAVNPEPRGPHGAGEIVDPKLEGRDWHAVAACRYGAMAWLDPTPKPVEEPADPRAAAVRRMAEAEREEDEEFARW